METMFTKGIGENIASFVLDDLSNTSTQCQGPTKPRCTQCHKIVAKWYAEESNYDYNKGESKGGDINNFTQIVWKNTTELGIATATSKNNLFVVARYKPQGNLFPPENFKKNVLRPE